MDKTEMSEVLCLKWNNHKSIFLQNLSSLRTQELYSDATITCNGKYFSVHRLVLSTCSQYFEEIFERISMQSIHPFIIVTNIESGYLEALLNFMYNGEVNVLQEMLPGLIKAAEILKIKGLAIPDEETIEKELISAREREVNNAKIEQISSHSKSPVQSPSQRTQPSNETLQNNCLVTEEVSHTNHSPPVVQKDFPSEPNIYQAKDEVIDMCSVESSREFSTSINQERSLKIGTENEVKIEGGNYENQRENLHSHIPHQNFSLPINRPQVLPPQENINLQEVPYTYNAAVEQDYRTESLAKEDIEAEHMNTKCSSWENQMNEKEVNSNVATASVVQEVIHGILLQTENETSTCSTQEAEEIHPLPPPVLPPPPPPPLPTIAETITVKREDPMTPVKARMKKRNNNNSPEQVSPTSKKCPKCPYVTKYVSTLRRHIMFKHTGEKPHKCHYCPYRSAHNFNMKKHMMIHTGEKPFSCPICPYKAAQNSNIKSHMKSHENKLLKAAIKGTKKEKM